MLTIQFNLDPATINPSGNESFDDATIEHTRQALQAVIQKAQVTALDNQIGKLVREGFEEFMDNRNKDAGMPLSEEDVKALTAFVMKRMEPFLAHLARTPEFPFDDQGS